MSILVLTLLCVYVHYNALDLYIKLFALYKNILFMKVIKNEVRFKTGFQQPKIGFPKNPLLTSLMMIKDVNKDLTPKDQDKDNDLTPKDQHKDLRPQHTGKET